MSNKKALLSLSCALLCLLANTTRLYASESAHANTATAAPLSTATPATVPTTAAATTDVSAGTAATAAASAEKKSGGEKDKKKKRSRRTSSGKVKIREVDGSDDESSSSSSSESDRSKSKLLTVAGSTAASTSLSLDVLGAAASRVGKKANEKAKDIWVKDVAKATAAVDAAEIRHARRNEHFKRKLADPTQLKEDEELDKKRLAMRLEAEKDELRKIREASKELEAEFEKEDDKEYEAKKAKRLKRLEEEAEAEAKIQGRSHAERVKAAEDPLLYKAKMATVEAIEDGYKGAITDEVKSGLKSLFHWTGKAIYYAFPENAKKRDAQREHEEKEEGLMQLRALMKDDTLTTLNKAKAIEALSNGPVQRELSLLEAEKSEINQLMVTTRKIKDLIDLPVGKTDAERTKEKQLAELFEEFEELKETVLTNNLPVLQQKALEAQQQIPVISEEIKKAQKNADEIKAKIDALPQSVSSMLSDDPDQREQLIESLTDQQEAIEQMEEMMLQMLNLPNGIIVCNKLKTKEKIVATFKDSEHFAFFTQTLKTLRTLKMSEIQQSKDKIKTATSELVSEVSTHNSQQRMHNSFDRAKLSHYLSTPRKKNKKDTQENKEKKETEPSKTVAELQKEDGAKPSLNAVLKSEETKEKADLTSGETQPNKSVADLQKEDAAKSSSVNTPSAAAA